LIDDAIRIKVIRALLGISGKELAQRIGVTATTVTSWESRRYVPHRGSREILAKICEENRIMFLPSGMPVPADDILPAQEMTNGR
jgi:DNA-binding transcriptional regulator YiaG